MILRPLEVSVKHPAEHKTPVPLHPRKALNNIADKRLRYEICVFTALEAEAWLAQDRHPAARPATTGDNHPRCKSQTTKPTLMDKAETGRRLLREDITNFKAWSLRRLLLSITKMLPFCLCVYNLEIHILAKRNARNQSTVRTS